MVTVNGVRLTITGVAVPGFAGEVVGASTDLWLPIGVHDEIKPHDRVLEHRTDMWLLLIGRAKAGLTVAQVTQRVIPVIRSSILAHATSKQLGRLTKQELEYPISSGARGLSLLRWAPPPHGCHPVSRPAPGQREITSTSIWCE